MSRITFVFRQPFFVLLILTVFSFSIPVYAQGNSVAHDVSGEASVVIVDHVDGTSELQYFIIDNINRRETRVYFNGKAHSDFKTGRQIKVHGKGRADGKGINAETILLLDEGQGSATGDASSAAPVASAESRNVLTILVDFNDATVSTGSYGVSLQAAKDRMYNQTKNVSDFYYNASLTTLTIPPDPDGDGIQDVFGPYHIDDSYIGGDSNQCTASTWVTKASAAWEAANPGKDISLYRHRLLIVPNYWDWTNRHCTWGGVAQLNCGTWCWAIAADPISILHGVIVHELGHNFSLHHSSTDTDNNGSINSEYGDNSDQMGGSRNWMKFNPPHFEDKGWMDSVEYELRTVVPSSTVQSFDLIPLDEEAWDWPGLRALKLERGSNSDYYISFRQQTGDYNKVTSSYTSGLSLHYGTDGSTRSYFIRMIAPGETFVDSAANVSITATSQTTVSDGSGSVEVMGVEICDTFCSSIPAPTGLTVTAASKSMINLSWVDNHDAEDGYDIERSADGSSWSPLAQLGAGAISYADGGLATATTYYYRVQTVEGAVRSSFSNVASTTTLAVPPTAGFTYAATYTEARFTDTSSDSDGTVLGWSWDFGDGNGSNSQNPTHTYASGSTYVVKLTVTDNHGATATATQDVTVEDPPFVNFYASSELTSGGTLSGNLNATKLNDGAVESVTERESGGKPANRYSWAEHRWTINVDSSGDASVVINAWQSSSTDGDTFDFEWSSNGTNWSPVFNVSAISNPGTPRSFGLPTGTSGTVYVRVIDTNRASGNRSKDTVHVDLLMVQVANASGEAPNGTPANLAAEAVSFDSINLSWDDNSDNESGFRIERRNVTASGAFADVGTTGVNGNSTASFTDTGLTGETTYEYQVIAFNGVGTSSYSNTASATTAVAPDIQLNASGRKLKGKHTVDLDWTISSASDMDVYQGATVIGSVTAGTIVYTHNMSSKGGASYDYKVCKSNTTTCSNTVTVVF